jgi:hypothetical protein
MSVVSAAFTQTELLQMEVPGLTLSVWNRMNVLTRG